jgi:transposase
MQTRIKVISLSPEERYGLRMAAWAMWRKGTRAPSIASALGMNRSTVDNWCGSFSALREPGPESKRGPKPGAAPSGLTARQEARAIRVITDRTPEQLKFDFALWTCECVRDLLLRLFGVELCGRTVRRYLKKWGFTLQHPERRARERDEAAVRRWLDDDYPRIKRAAKRAKAVVYWADQSSVKASEQRPRGYSPRGKAPVCRTVADQGCKASVMSAISNTGKARFMLLKTALNVALFIKFMERLTKDADKPVFLIVDNLRVHHAKALKPWLEKNRGRLRLFHLPSYSPDLNPDEYLNQDLKQAVNARAGARTGAKLAATVASHLRKRVKQPAVIKNFFKHPKIKYAA